MKNIFDFPIRVFTQGKFRKMTPTYFPLPFRYAHSYPASFSLTYRQLAQFPFSI